MAEQRMTVLTARIVIECPVEDADKMTSWVTSRVKSAVDFSNNGMVAIAVYNEDGVMVGTNTVGQSQSMTQSELLDKLGKTA